MKRTLLRVAALLLAVCMLLPTAAPVSAAGNKWINPYTDVTTSMWSYVYIRSLGMAGVLPASEVFEPYVLESRGNFVSYLYAMHLALGGKAERGQTAPFEDVGTDHPNRTAILWAKKNNIVNGISETEFGPDMNVTREHICAIVMRYARFAKISMRQYRQPGQFRDSHKISDYAKSDVVACQLAGIVNGFPEGLFRPKGEITREQCAAMIYRLMHAAQTKVTDQMTVVSLEEDAYLSVYETFDPAFVSLVPESKPVDLSYFDDCVFIGDSVSVTLEYYCAATGALGNAQFLCAGSLSAYNALWPVTHESVHPYFQGEKMLVEDGVAACGAKIVYIMLGINSLAGGVDGACRDMVTLIDRILEKSPDVQIVLQSTTPMVRNNTIQDGVLNNENIRLYALKLQEICDERGWYFVDVAECVTDEEGYLVDAYCSDNGEMGIHFTYDGAKVWTDYLVTHVPAALLKK